MSRAEPSVSEIDLNAYIDDRLDARRRAEVELFLEAHPDAAEKVRTGVRVNQGLHQLFDGPLDEPVPERLLSARRRRRPVRPAWQAAAVVAALAVGLFGGWFARDWYAPRTASMAVMVDSALAAHVVYTPEVRHPVEVSHEEEKHLLGWLSKRLGTDIRAPGLGSLGYQLLGGRLLAAEDGEPAAQFMYQNAGGDRLTLYVRHKRGAEQDTAFRYARHDRVHSFYWIDGSLGYVLTGAAERAVISRAAHIVYEEINR